MLKNRKVYFLALLGGIMGWWGCSSAPKATNDSERIDDLLISFTVNAQASSWSEALALVTYEEQLKMIDGNGEVKPEFKAAMRRMKLTALQRQSFNLDAEGRLTGMFAVLVDANRRFKTSEAQRKLNLKDIERKHDLESKSDDSVFVTPKSSPSKDALDSADNDSIVNGAPDSAEVADSLETQDSTTQDSSLVETEAKKEAAEESSQEDDSSQEESAEQDEDALKPAAESDESVESSEEEDDLEELPELDGEVSQPDEEEPE